MLLASRQAELPTVLHSGICLKSRDSTYGLGYIPELRTLRSSGTSQAAASGARPHHLLDAHQGLLRGRRGEVAGGLGDV